MNTYLTIMVTILVLTQIVRIIQNTIQLRRQYKLFQAQLGQLDDITQEDLDMQRRAYLLQRIQHYLSVRATSSSTEVFSSHLCMYAPCHRRSDQQTALNFLLCHKILEH